MSSFMEINGTLKIKILGVNLADSFRPCPWMNFCAGLLTAMYSLGYLKVCRLFKV